MISDIRDILIPSTTSILETLRVIDQTALEIALVVDSERRLHGTVTDGDIRRAILRGCSLETPVQQIMNQKPTVMSLDTPDDEALFTMSGRQIKSLPVLDREGRVTGLTLWRELVGRRRRETWAVIMAGGLGSRLGSLTAEVPKPLLTVGSRPLLGTIISRLRQFGIWKIFVAVNYRAEQIISYLGDGSAFDVQVEYLREDQPLGTAGPLSLLPSIPTEPLLVMNADLLTRLNFGNLLEYHVSSHKEMTVCVRTCHVEIPFGVVQVQGNDLVEIVEKPSQEILINSGIYVLEPRVLSRVPAGQRFDMPELIRQTAGQGNGVGCFPLADFWMDIGRPEEYQRAQTEYRHRFGETAEDHGGPDR